MLGPSQHGCCDLIGNPSLRSSAVNSCLAQRCAKIVGRLRRGLGLFEISVKLLIGLPNVVGGTLGSKGRSLEPFGKSPSGLNPFCQRLKGKTYVRKLV
jgi:hypothetical protein